MMIEKNKVSATVNFLFLEAQLKFGKRSKNIREVEKNQSTKYDNRNIDEKK